MQAKAERATKRSAGKRQIQQPQQGKKRKVTEPAATAWADSGSQPEGAGAADAEAATAADGQAGPLSEDRLIQWGGKQKRKRARPGPAVGSCGLPDQARRAPQQKLLPPYFSSAIDHASDHPAAAAVTAAGAAAVAATGTSEAAAAYLGSAEGAIAGHDDDHAVASDTGSEEFEQQVAELKGERESV